MLPLRSLPRATYRLQLHREFGFRQATLALPYLAALGVSHVYCSPYLRATPGSMHGYDVVDPTMINPDLGSSVDFDEFNRQLRAHGLSQLLDIVPNHMGIDSAENAWWQDVLERGETSAYAGYFDIDWSGARGVPRGRLLLPILGAPLEQIIADGELQLHRDEDRHAWHLRYFERDLPVNARGTALLLAAAADDPFGGDAATAKRLADPALLSAVADCQHYLLAPWQDAAVRINYRRFFDVSGLAALRIEDPTVFEATHRLVIELVRTGIVSGLRVDHPDGLRDPGTYFKELQSAVAEPGAGPLYVVAEKILAEGEKLPADWPVSGTTGYDFANLACGVLLDFETADAIDAVWRDFTGERTPTFADMAHDAKLEVLALSFGSELRALSEGLRDLVGTMSGGSASAAVPALADASDWSATALAEILAEVIACFPVYRTYPGDSPSAADQRVVRQACREALQRLDQRLPTSAATTRHADLLAALEAILLGPSGEWVIRFQQLCAPVMAKGVEDTALYRWTRLVSINDVGADPDVAGVPPDRFHESNRARLAGWPHSMLTTSTHDNKRGEYVRMRINVASEAPDRWREMASSWHDSASVLMQPAESPVTPDASDLYLLFQTILGTWPVQWPLTRTHSSDLPADYGDRLKAYMTKAGREAKRRTSWTQPDEAYEESIHRLIERMIENPQFAARIAADVAPFAWYGALNSLSLTALKLTSPGVPDIYQGSSVLDDSLVDPDNRRPVDFVQRQALIGELSALDSSSAGTIRNALSGWLAEGDFDRLKLWMIHRLLGWRARNPLVFEAGSYVPVTATGERARHCLAYARCYGDRGILVLATRLYRQLGYPGPVSTDGATTSGATAADRPATTGTIWVDTTLDLSTAGIRAHRFVDLLTRRVEHAEISTDADPTSPDFPDPSTPLRLDRLLETLPVAVLAFEIVR